MHFSTFVLSGISFLALSTASPIARPDDVAAAATKTDDATDYSGWFKGYFKYPIRFGNYPPLNFAYQTAEKEGNASAAAAAGTAAV